MVTTVQNSIQGPRGGARAVRRPRGLTRFLGPGRGLPRVHGRALELYPEREVEPDDPRCPYCHGSQVAVQACSDLGCLDLPSGTPTVLALAMRHRHCLCFRRGCHGSWTETWA